MNKKFFQDKGREGGKKGGLAKGERKRRPPKHYKRISALAVEARRKKKEDSAK